MQTLQGKLTSSEVAQLWTTYMSNSMAKQKLRYFLAKCEDAEIHNILDYALQLANKMVNSVSEFFKQANHPIPQGFTDEDVDTNAPPLFTDTFFLRNINILSQYGLVEYSLGLSTSVRPDIRKFFTDLLKSTSDLYNKSTEVLVKKGLYVQAPSIPTPEKVDFVHRQSFLTGWFGDRRPLTVIEINNLFFSLRGSAMAKAVLMGFSQVAKSQEVRAHFVRAVEIIHKDIEIFQSILSENELPAQPTYESEVTNSTVTPYSDKLMMHLVSILAKVAIGRFSTALETSSRRDLGTHFVRIIGEVLKYAEDHENIMINQGWLEQPPTAPDRKALTRI